MKKKITAIFLVCASLTALSSCRFTTMEAMLSSASTAPTQTGEYMTIPQQTVTDPSVYVPTTLPQQNITVETTVPVTQPSVVITSAPDGENATSPNVVTDFSNYGNQQILETYVTALNRTRSYTGALTVHHKEDFTAQARDITPAVPLANKLVNSIISSIGKPSELDYKYTNGVALNEDAETVPILLPQKNNFALTIDGVQRAAIESINGQTHIVIRLVPEKVGFGEIPPYNAAAIGYLDTASLDLKLIKINSCEITYPGSLIDAYIRPDGYISQVTYTIGMTVDGNVSGMGLTGSGIIEGAQTEVWTLNW